MNDVTNRILAGNEALSLEEAAMRAAEELSNRDQLAKVIEARNKAINTRIAAQRLGELRTTWKDRPDIGLEAMLVGRNDARTGSRRSVASEVAQLRGKYNSGINYDFDQAGLVKFISSGSNDGRSLTLCGALPQGRTGRHDLAVSRSGENYIEVAGICACGRESSRGMGW